MNIPKKFLHTYTQRQRDRQIETQTERQREKSGKHYIKIKKNKLEIFK